jgi:hypothetical protein
MFTSLTDVQIQQAILKLVEHYPHHPPTLGEFVEMARLGISRDEALRDKPRDPVEDMSHYATGANRVMYTIVMAKNGVSDPALKRMLAEKKRLVHDFELMAEDEETKPDWEKFVYLIDERLRHVLEPATAA